MGATPLDLAGSLLRRPEASRLRRRRARYEGIKRGLDVGLTLLAIPVAMPLMAACAVLVWLDSGHPIVFMQMRTGRGGRRFKFHKFRTMVPDAEALKPTILDANELSGPDFKVAHDPRVTRVGHWLRCSSLDELPQLFDVLRGDMSLVGPRPTSFDASSYQLWHTERLEVSPGLTGLWQVMGRADIDFDDRVRLDIEYIQKRSILFDLRIMFRTLRVIVDRKGAY